MADELERFAARRRAELADVGTDLAPFLDSAVAFVAGGKRLRPLFCRAGWLVAGGDPDDPALVTAAASLEWLQASALVHDDLMDGSDTRRGHPSVHRDFEARHRAVEGSVGDAARFGQATAVLLGDLMLSWADEQLRSSGLPRVPEALRYLDLCRSEVVAGQYLDVLAPSADLLHGLVYPVPDPRFPFLGVHLTRSLDGHVHAGPNAVLALAREGYGRWSLSPRDLAETLAWPGTGRLIGRYWRPGLDELRRSLSRRRFVRAAQRLLPDLDAADFRRAPSGIRAQSLDRQGSLVDDFHLVDGDRAVHVVNAPSPAATASLAIGEVVADRVAGRITRH